jgi:hypothetical protein
MQYYFDAKAYEYFLITPAVVTFASALEDLAAETMSMYPGDSEVLRARKQHWVRRTTGRATVQVSTFERAPPSFWRDLRVEFGGLDGADLRAAIKGDGWWLIQGGPWEPAAKETLRKNFDILVRRAMAALGFCDRPMAVEVWLDILKRESPHSIEWGVDHLCFACEDYCSVLETRALDAGPPARNTEISRRSRAGSPKPGPSEDRADLKWEEVEIRFLSDERTQVIIKNHTETWNYSEAGFEDKRNGTPNQAWAVLRKLAEGRGFIDKAKIAASSRAKAARRIQEIRRTLRLRFSISDDPIAFEDGMGYQARFRISCAPSYET